MRRLLLQHIPSRFFSWDPRHRLRLRRLRHEGLPNFDFPYCRRFRLLRRYSSDCRDRFRQLRTAPFQGYRYMFLRWVLHRCVHTIHRARGERRSSSLFYSIGRGFRRFENTVPPNRFYLLRRFRRLPKSSVQASRLYRTNDSIRRHRLRRLRRRCPSFRLRPRQIRYRLRLLLLLRQPQKVPELNRRRFDS